MERDKVGMVAECGVLEDQLLAGALEGESRKVD